MASEGPSHRVMREAFEKRLKQLFPESEYHYSFGKQLANGLKPDVYIRHPDGQQCVYEMVHGNRHPAHLNDNHHRYQASGIQDIWILWDDLRPRFGEPLSMQQGVFIDLISSEYLVVDTKLTSPQREILNMQPPGVRFLYAFSVTPLAPDLNIELLNMLSIGINSYAFHSISQPGTFHVTRTFIPMVEMGFNDEGLPINQPNPAFEGIKLQDLGQALGLEDFQAVIPVAFMQQFMEMIKDPYHIQQLMVLYLSSILKEASPELLSEIKKFGDKTTVHAVEPYRSTLGPHVSQQLFRDPSLLKSLAEESKAVLTHILAQELSPVIKQFLIDLLNQPVIQDSSDWVEWQTANPILDLARSSAMKKKK
jgi:hypothetical protein